MKKNCSKLADIKQLMLHNSSKQTQIRTSSNKIVQHSMCFLLTPLIILYVKYIDPTKLSEPKTSF